MTDEEFEDYLAAALAELQAKQDALRTEYGLGEHQRFVVDFEKGNLTFFENESPVVEAEIIPVATHVADKNSLKWSWANEQLPPRIRDEASQVKRLYDITGFELFKNELVDCDDAMAWELTALACKCLEKAGAYRIPHPNLNSYVLIKGVKWFSGR